MLRLPWHECLINLIGAILHEIATPSASGYAYWIHDVNGLIALANAKLQLLEQQVLADGIAEALRASQWRNLYDDSPLIWDGGTQMLSFLGPYPASRANRLRHSP